MTNWRLQYVVSVPLCFARLYDGSCAQSYYLHSDLFCCGCDPYNHRHVFNISFTDNEAHACRVACMGVSLNCRELFPVSRYEWQHSLRRMVTSRIVLGPFTIHWVLLYFPLFLLFCYNQATFVCAHLSILLNRWVLNRLVVTIGQEIVGLLLCVSFQL